MLCISGYQPWLYIGIIWNEGEGFSKLSVTLNKIKIAKVISGTNIFKYPETQRKGHMKMEAETEDAAKSQGHLEPQNLGKRVVRTSQGF